MNIRERLNIRIIDIYIIRKFLGTFFYAISLLIVIVIIFDVSEKIDDFIEKQAPLSEIIFSYYLNFIPYFINLFGYLFTFIAVIFFTSKMANNTEIVAILSSGISFRRFLVPYVVSAFVLTIMSFFLANFIIPETNKNLLAFERQYIKNPYRNVERNIHMQIQPGEYVYLENYNTSSTTGYRFSLEKFRDNRMYYKLSADRIVWDSLTGKWQIINYFIRELDGKREKLTKGKTIDTIINMHPRDFVITVDDIKTMNFSQLNKFIYQERMKGSDNIEEFVVEKHKRIAYPFATIVLTLIGVSLSSRKIRGGMGTHLGAGIALTFTFILFMQVSTVFATMGNLSPIIAAWLPNIIFGVLGIYLTRIAPK